ncbi:hypothetical protein [Bathymodiolus platifrons methanotrophic gill symbiont]|uniref:hypothetical protein n=1 Tax=Bathymodiolus platifrons methanotrophic gill symbiont TaxID=113268 RepID=UPI0011250A3F|nr:hypothetical protein [Bathymodiolus platifrons methanotrophic gill symbiont]
MIVEQDFLHPTMNIGLTFPGDWKISNQPQYVSAVNKQKDGLLILELQGEGNDPVKAAHDFLNKAKIANQSVS